MAIQIKAVNVLIVAASLGILLSSTLTKDDWEFPEYTVEGLGEKSLTRQIPDWLGTSVTVALKI